MQMFFFVYLGAFLLLKRLQVAIKPTPYSTKWNRILGIGAWLIFGLMFLLSGALNDKANAVISPFLLGAVIWYTRREPDFGSMRGFVNTFIPLAVVGLIDGLILCIFTNFYNNYDDYFVFADLAAFLWIFARWASIKKQLRELHVITIERDKLEAMVSERTAEITEQRNALEQTIKELKATQAQLIQSEKMASLGELTAGIAHEIQNPLNFVNNFSEVSVELLDEMEEELNKGDTEEVLAIAADIKQNLEKIRHHGKRADGIVKGMLQHSRATGEVKEPTDINKLADEYLRLAYHGLRAKDKSFNAEMITHFTENLPAVNIFPQDVGRVLLNLFTNAFYATQQKKKTGITDYKPVVELTTSVKNHMIVVQVRDNGTGIPDAIKSKIMQPFFTTKPTGEGTGLGLSLSYDIVVKAHNGKIDVQSKEGEYTSFTISLPL